VSSSPGQCPICGMDLVKVEPEPPAATAAARGAPLYYRHPHDPKRTSPTPRKDEMGMDYVPVFADAAGPEVRISPAVINNLGVRSEPATLGALPRRAETTGYVTFDDRRVQNGQVQDDDRIGYLDGHLRAMRRAMFPPMRPRPIIPMRCSTASPCESLSGRRMVARDARRHKCPARLRQAASATRVPRISSAGA